MYGMMLILHTKTLTETIFSPVFDLFTHPTSFFSVFPIQYWESIVLQEYGAHGISCASNSVGQLLSCLRATGLLRHYAHILTRELHHFICDFRLQIQPEFEIDKRVGK